MGYSFPTITTTATVVTTAIDGDVDDVKYFSEKLAVSILLVALSVLGTLGNGLVLCVYSRRCDKATATIFILSLAWCDFFTSLIIMPFVVVFVQLDQKLIYDVICKLYHFLITSNVPLSVYIIVAVAVDRYCSICHPFLRIVTPRRARISIVCLCLLASFIGAFCACVFGVYYLHISYVPAGNCSDYMDNNAAQNDAIFSFSNGNGNSRDGTSVSPQDITNFTNLYYRLNIQYSGKRHHHQQPHEKNYTIPNVISSPESICSSMEMEKTYVYHHFGVCFANHIIFTKEVSNWFSYVYFSTYIISFVSVFILYLLTYRFVVKRRAWRRKMKRRTFSPMTTGSNNAHVNIAKKELGSIWQNTDEENVEPSPKMASSDNGVNVKNEGDEDGDGEVSGKLTGVTDSEISGCKCKDTTSSAACTGSDHKESGCESGTGGVEKETRREILSQDSDFLANVRTAAMLFVVTIVFVISFLPAWLMALYLIDYHILVFYMYFINNMANPFIYAFMNQSFRKDLKWFFQRCFHSFRRP